MKKLVLILFVVCLAWPAVGQAPAQDDIFRFRTPISIGYNVRFDESIETLAQIDSGVYDHNIDVVGLAQFLFEVTNPVAVGFEVGAGILFDRNLTIDVGDGTSEIFPSASYYFPLRAVAVFELGVIHIDVIAGTVLMIIPDSAQVRNNSVSVTLSPHQFVFDAGLRVGFSLFEWASLFLEGQYTLSVGIGIGTSTVRPSKATEPIEDNGAYDYWRNSLRVGIGIRLNDWWLSGS